MIQAHDDARAPTKPRAKEIAHSAYQRSAVELREDLWLEETLEDVIKALVQPMRVRYVLPNKHKLSTRKPVLVRDLRT